MDITYINTMDVGDIVFMVILRVLDEWSGTGRAFIDFPTYYRPDLGH